MVNKVGEKYITNEGYIIEIVEYINNKNCTIQFEDMSIFNNLQYGHIIRGKVKNPSHRSVYRTGFIGIGKYNYKKSSKIYRIWSGLLERGYCSKFKEKYFTYKYVTVCEEWHNFQNFAKWFEENYNPETMEGWHLDKDIIVKGNKVYSPETCCFVPQEINLLFTKCNSKRGLCSIGVCKVDDKFKSSVSKNNKTTNIGFFNTPEEAFQSYKTAKEKEIKRVADKWKPFITPETHQAMYNYQVAISD